jgi:predicted outer membrane repeat protein
MSKDSVAKVLRIMRRPAVISLSNIVLGLLLISGVSRPAVANARTIIVNNSTDVPVPGFCTLRQAVVSHNKRAYVFPSSCEVGDGNDTIILKNVTSSTIDLGSPLNPIENGRLVISHSLYNFGSNCLNLRQAAYMTVNQGAELDLDGVSVIVNGAEPRSIIDNDGGRLTIDGSKCVFSNQSGRGAKTTVGAVLNNRNGGSAKINAIFENNSAGDKGGAIYIESGSVQVSGTFDFDTESLFSNDNAGQGGAIYVNNGNLTVVGSSTFTGDSANQGGAIYVNAGTVTIQNSAGTDEARPNTFQQNSANQGGAIYLNTGATLKADSNDYLFSRNQAGASGGAIYSNGGNVTLARGGNLPFLRASVSFNNSPTGAAIYSAGGQLSLDGIEVNNNTSSGSGGAIVVSDIKPPTPASITRSYFHNNSAGVNGGAIYLLNGSTLNLAASTFTNDRASGLGGAIYGDTLSNLNVLNSTFLGGVNNEGIVASGLGNVVFSTIVAANLGVGSTPTTHLSNSIIRQVSCSGVTDDGLNLQFQSTGCPGSIPAMNPDLDPRFLANNGGPTPTIALLGGSPAIGAIAIGDCVDQNNNPVKTDQRGFARPDAADPIHCDMGAYEFGARP